MPISPTSPRPPPAKRPAGPAAPSLRPGNDDDAQRQLEGQHKRKARPKREKREKREKHEQPESARQPDEATEQQQPAVSLQDVRDRDGDAPSQTAGDAGSSAAAGASAAAAATASKGKRRRKGKSRPGASPSIAAEVRAGGLRLRAVSAVLATAALSGTPSSPATAAAQSTLAAVALDEARRGGLRLHRPSRLTSAAVVLVPGLSAQLLQLDSADRQERAEAEAAAEMDAPLSPTGSELCAAAGASGGFY